MLFENRNPETASLRQWLKCPPIFEFPFSIFQLQITSYQLPFSRAWEQ
jgi:hypothetical protein